VDCFENRPIISKNICRKILLVRYTETTRTSLTVHQLRQENKKTIKG